MASIEALRETNNLSIDAWRWSSITENDTCKPVTLPIDSDKTIQVIVPAGGGFGGGTISIEGSLMDLAPVYFTVNKPDVSAMTFSAAGGDAVLENVWKLRPKVPTGTSVLLDVLVLAS